MAIYKVTSTFHALSNLPVDRKVNSVHLEGPLPSLNLANLCAAWASFYNASPPGAGGNSVGQYMGHDITSFDVDVRRIDLPAPHLPLAFINGNGLPARLNPEDLPNEVAVCVSIQGTVPLGVDESRGRGRIFVGPWNQSVIPSGTYPARPNNVTVLLGQAMAEFKADALALGFTLGIWSPTGASFTEAEDGWVDNEFDTMRKRGPEATSRNVFAL